MKLKYEFVTTEADNEIIAVPVGSNASEFKGVLNLNSTGAAILSLMKNETTVEEIARGLSEKYDASAAELTPYVERFINKLRAAKLLEE